jgi:hypothetical protein
MFRHPHLTRGIVKTPMGAFIVTRGLVEMPAEVGESLGWRPVDQEDERPAGSPLARPQASSRMASSAAEGYSGE